MRRRVTGARCSVVLCVQKLTCRPDPQGNVEKKEEETGGVTDAEKYNRDFYFAMAIIVTVGSLSSLVLIVCRMVCLLVLFVRMVCLLVLFVRILLVLIACLLVLFVCIVCLF
jgi:hypothetical protein